MAGLRSALLHATQQQALTRLRANLSWDQRCRRLKWWQHFPEVSVLPGHCVLCQTRLVLLSSINAKSSQYYVLTGHTFRRRGVSQVGINGAYEAACPTRILNATNNS